MKWREIIEEELDPETEKLLGPNMPPELRAEMEDVFRRDPPPRLSPSELTAMYNPHVEEEELKNRLLRAQVRKAEKEADLASAKADAQRLGINRPS